MIEGPGHVPLNEVAQTSDLLNLLSEMFRIMYWVR